jgi:hypothetical protein
MRILVQHGTYNFWKYRYHRMLFPFYKFCNILATMCLALMLVLTNLTNLGVGVGGRFAAICAQFIAS